MFSLRTQIEMIKKELQLEKEKNSALVNENQVSSFYRRLLFLGSCKGKEGFT